jgi:stringent starvation protein B
VLVDETVQVPREYVKNGEIVLNISFDATSSLKLGNEFIEFKARFAGSAREIMVPVSRVIAIYARENGQGMAFPMPVVTAPGDGARQSLLPLSSVRHACAQHGPCRPTVTARVQLVTPEGQGADGSDAPEPPRTTGRSAAGLKRVK